MISIYIMMLRCREVCWDAKGIVLKFLSDQTISLRLVKKRVTRSMKYTDEKNKLIVINACLGSQFTYCTEMDCFFNKFSYG